MNDAYDTPWKDALSRYFPEFMAFYFPAAYSDIEALDLGVVVLHEQRQLAVEVGPVTAAHPLTQQTRGQHVQRHAAKWRLARLLYERQWDKQRVIDLFNVIDWMMWLPSELQQRLIGDLRNLEGRLGMPYVNSFESLGLERGRQEGRQALSELLAIQLEQRFGILPDAVHERLRHAKLDELQRWGTVLIDASSLDQVLSAG